MERPDQKPRGSRPGGSRRLELGGRLKPDGRLGRPGRRGHVRRLGACLALGAVTLLAGCTTHAPPPLGLSSLAGMQHFRDFPVYWAGPRFNGIPLSQADRVRDYDPSLGLRLYYGGCLNDNSVFGGGGCTLPLEINTVLYVPHDNVGLGPRRQTRLRGVPAVIYDHGNSIELYTGLVLVDVFADSPRHALQAALALSPLNRNEYPGRQLPPPLFKPGVPSQPGAFVLPPVLPSPGFRPTHRHGASPRSRHGRPRPRIGAGGSRGHVGARGAPHRPGARRPAPGARTRGVGRPSRHGPAGRGAPRGPAGTGGTAGSNGRPAR